MPSTVRAVGVLILLVAIGRGAVVNRDAIVDHAIPLYGTRDIVRLTAIGGWEQFRNPSKQRKFYEVNCSNDGSNQLSWNKEALYCKERHGNLATIRSQEEMQQIINTTIEWAKERVYHSTWINVWIGATRSGSSRGFYWISDGQPVYYSDWYPGYPTTSGDCVYLYRDEKLSYGWANDNCTNTKCSICEFS